MEILRARSRRKERGRTAWTQSVAVDSIFGVVYCDLFREVDNSAFGGAITG